MYATQSIGVSGGGGNGIAVVGASATQAASTGITITNANQGSSNPMALLQPTMMMNCILRVI
jgi:hypothetical protein